MTGQTSEDTIDLIHSQFAAGDRSATTLVDEYLSRIEAYDSSGPSLNSIIAVNPHAREEAETLDRILASKGSQGPLHGVPVLLKDSIDAAGLPTTLGSTLFKDFYPNRDSKVVTLLRQAGAIILGKTTLGELGGGDTHGTLFGSTRNPYDTTRTSGGSSGGSAVAVSANFCLVAVAQEGFSSTRRPAAWNSVVGMRPTAGLVPRTGVYGGWPGIAGAIGPMTRTVADAARLLDVMAAYDDGDPLTALSPTRRTARTFQEMLDRDALAGARVGVLRESMGNGSDPSAADFQEIDAIFDRTVLELREAGAELVDPIKIPDLNRLLAARADADRGGGEAAFNHYLAGVESAPFARLADVFATPGYQPRGSIQTVKSSLPLEHIEARDELMFNVLQAMERYQLDAIVHRTTEHEPMPIAERDADDFVNMRGATHLNTFLAFVPSISVPNGFMTNGLPTGVTFLGQPYTDWRQIALAYAYEQATMHRIPPATAPPLPPQ